jgi:hypothetical protein
MDPDRLYLERARASFDRTHVFTTSFIYDTPAVTRALGSQNPVLKGILDNWELSNIVSFSTGGPITIASGRDINLDGPTTDRPNLVQGQNPELPTDRPRGDVILKYFNTAAFAFADAGRLGTLGRGILTGPGLISWDFGLFKNFPINAIKEGAKIQFRFEAFNFPNRVNLSNPNTSLAAGANFGRITQARDPRIIQFGLRFAF